MIETGDACPREIVEHAALSAVKWVHLAPLFRGDFDLAQLARLARGRRILFDGQGLLRLRELGPLQLNADFDRDILRHVSILKLSLEEAEVIGDLLALGIPEIVVTHGRDGVRVITSSEDFFTPADPISADPTGAGDAFAGAYLAARADGQDPRSATLTAARNVEAMLRRRTKPLVQQMTD